LRVSAAGLVFLAAFLRPFLAAFLLAFLPVFLGARFFALSGRFLPAARFLKSLRFAFFDGFFVAFLALPALAEVLVLRFDFFAMKAPAKFRRQSYQPLAASARRPKARKINGLRSRL
jgi:hypothetical protein